MLGEVNSEELTEWCAYFSIKEKQSEDNEKAQKAKQRAKENNF